MATVKTTLELIDSLSSSARPVAEVAMEFKDLDTIASAALTAMDGLKPILVKDGRDWLFDDDLLKVVVATGKEGSFIDKKEIIRLFAEKLLTADEILASASFSETGLKEALGEELAAKVIAAAKKRKEDEAGNPILSAASVSVKPMNKTEQKEAAIRLAKAK